MDTVNDLSALEGSTAVLFCIAEGAPSPTITWKKGSQVIEDDERHDSDSSGTLTISDLQVQNVCV